jgi:pimeloyl-ACP methyl ester carboxylesterase
VVLAGAGHACYMEKPDEFHAELLAWLSEQK